MHISTRNKLKYFGIKRYCPVCRSWLRYFKPAGINGRRNALCPVCGSFERHRLVWLFFKKTASFIVSANVLGGSRAPRRGEPKKVLRTIFRRPYWSAEAWCVVNQKLLRGGPGGRFSRKEPPWPPEATLKMLHAAPENCFVRRFKANPYLDYISIDFASPLADRQMDLTALDFPAGTFDFFYCSHVLEHIPDDGKAIAEIYRVLKPGGTAVIMVPLAGEKTVEDPSVTDPAEREKLYGQADHVRIYGKDFILRLRDKGFIATEIDFYVQLHPVKRWFCGLNRESIFLCKKP